MRGPDESLHEQGCEDFPYVVEKQKHSLEYIKLDSIRGIDKRAAYMSSDALARMQNRASKDKGESDVEPTRVEVEDTIGGGGGGG